MKERLIANVFIVVLLFNSIVMPTSESNTFKQFPNKYFVETGSLMGEGIERALQAGFTHVYSIELSAQFFGHCKKKFANNSEVELFWGDSGKILYDVIKDIDSSITFWLDGHYGGNVTAKGDEWSPILKELEQIKKHPIKTHTILIDDVRLMGTEYFDFVTIDQIIEKVLEINADYKLFFIDGYVKNDILVATVRR